MFLIAKIMQKNDSPKRISGKLAPKKGFVRSYRPGVPFLLSVPFSGFDFASPAI